LNETRSGDHEGHEGGRNPETKGRSPFLAAFTLVVMMMIAMIVHFTFIVMIV
jgi:hypothetical protein